MFDLSSCEKPSV